MLEREKTNKPVMYLKRFKLCQSVMQIKLKIII